MTTIPNPYRKPELETRELRFDVSKEAYHTLIGRFPQHGSTTAILGNLFEQFIKQIEPKLELASSLEIVRTNESKFISAIPSLRLFSL